RAIVDNILRMGQEPATTYVPPGIFPGFKVEPGYPVDIERGKKLFAETPFAGQKILPGVSILYSSNVPAFTAIAQNVSSQWRQNLGIEVPVEQQESKVRRERVNNKEYS